MATEPVSLRLESWYIPRSPAPGRLRLRLVNTGPTPITGFQLAFTSIVQLDPPAPAELVSRTSGAHVFAPPADLWLEPGGVWEIDGVVCGHRPLHSNDGPSSAFAILTDGATVPVRTSPVARAAPVLVGEEAPPTVRLLNGSTVAHAAWATSARCEQRLHRGSALVLTDDGAAGVTATIDAALAPDAYSIGPTDDGWTLVAGSPDALRQGVGALARAIRSHQTTPPSRQVLHAPRYEWRGLHVDLARQFFPATDVDWLIDLASWRGLNRLHLHLTDDEAWRVQIEAYRALTDIGSWRGHTLAIPPLLGSPSAAFGGSYSRADIARWVDRAGELGVQLVPEIDLPGHCFAALAAMPELVDPADTSGAFSVQYFVDNVLNPGVAATWPMLEAVFGELADLFPASPIHVGGDEVPAGTWRGSPAAQRYAAERGISGADAIAAAFLRDVIDLIVATTGRAVGAWQEAAECGALRPGAGYAVGWKSAADCRALAANGHRVVAAPAEVYYLDMATDRDWYSPGASWAGRISVADIEAYDLTVGWTDAERANLLGIQACIWTEHVHDRPALERFLLPRLDAIAAAAWDIN